MKAAIKQEFIEKGYGQFPYIIVRQFPAFYSQIPLIPRHLKNRNTQGIFIDALGSNQTKKFEKACKARFHKFWADENKKGSPLDMCLVLNADTGYYITKQGKVFENSIPSGGILKALDSSVIGVNTEHYIVTKEKDLNNLSEKLKEPTSAIIKTKEALRWWMNRYKTILKRN